jgi:hypothetical protein
MAADPGLEEAVSWNPLCNGELRMAQFAMTTDKDLLFLRQLCWILYLLYE